MDHAIHRHAWAQPRVAAIPAGARLYGLSLSFGDWILAAPYILLALRRSTIKRNSSAITRASSLFHGERIGGGAS
jgi:hypothetical protein